MNPAAPQVLIIDSDAELRAGVESAFSALGWSVEEAGDGTGAIDILQTTRVDAVVCENGLPDMAGLQVHRRMMQWGRLKGVPFILMSSEDKPETIASALRSGVDDYLVKPLTPEVIALRVEAHVNRQSRRREQVTHRRYLLAGSFAAMQLPDLVSALSMQRRTGILSVVTGRAMAELFFDAGQLVHATYGNLSGFDAFCALFTEDSAQFEFTPYDTALPQASRTIRQPTVALVMDAARRIDESKKSPGSLPLPKPRAAAPAAAAPVTIKPDASVAQAMIDGIQGGFTLGELFMWVGTELDGWVRRKAQAHWLHLHLIADLSVGVGAMLALAAPPSERQVISGLGSGAKSVGLVFFLKNDQMLDIVLIDVNAAAARVHSLSKRPAITIIAPPRGDFFEIGPGARIGIDALLALRPPSLLVGVGSQSADSTLQKMAPTGTRSLLIPGTLDDGQTDLREVLVKGIEAWGQGGTK